MKHTIPELFDVVYRYYPRGVANDGDAYKQTEEYGRLFAARRSAGARRGEAEPVSGARRGEAEPVSGAGVDPWRRLLGRLRARFPEDDVQDMSTALLTGQHDAAYSGVINLPATAGARRSLGFMVSFLVPYYVLYRSRLVVDEEETARRRAPPQVIGVALHDTYYMFPRDAVSPDYLGAEDYQAKQSPPAYRQIIAFDLTPDEQAYAEWLTPEIEAMFKCEAMNPDVGQVIVPDVETNHRTFGEARLYDCLMSDVFW